MVTNSRPVTNFRRFAAVFGACCLLGAGACSGGGGTSNPGSGGQSAGTGGSASSGGKTGSGSGGSSSSGGAVGSGGVTGGSGGATASGGVSGSGTGGHSSSGGNPGSGGTPGSGGAASGGSTGAGGAASGGMAATGGAGDAGKSGGGATGMGGGHGGAGGASTCAGHAISFNANVAGNNDPAMARVNVAASADLPTGNAKRTVEFWAYVLSSSWSADANTMFFYGSNNRNNDGFGLDFGSTSGGIGTIDPFTNGSTDPMGDNKASGLMANTAQWAHFAMTWDGTTLRAFVNGVEKVSVPIAMLQTGMTALTIGGYPPAYFNGQIDEFRVWSVARSAAEISSTMNKPLNGDEANLTGYWKFDETSGTTVADSVTAAGHTAHPGTLMANSAANNPTFVVSTAPLMCN